MDILPPTKDWLDVLLAMIQILTLIALGIYVKKTWDMAVSAEETLQEMKDTRDQETSPYIVAYFEVSRYELYLVIENVVNEWQIM